tara:strand:+ start:3531 stop:4157 length:627 start_codon:yes stop_codon:yes gene_type:complete
MKEMKTKILIFAFFGLSVFFVYANYKKLLSSQLQVIFHKDLVDGSYSFNIDQLKEYDLDFPSLSFNMIPIETYLARYYLNQKKYEDALNNINAAIEKNPFSVYSFYLKARIYLDFGHQKKALNYLEKSYLLSNSTDYVAALYYTLLSENQNYKKLFSNYINVENSLNKNIWFYYLNAINSVDTKSYDSLILKINNRYNYLNEKNKLKN